MTLTLANKYRRAVGAEVPISFSVGVDRKNFPLLVACGFTPITTCTDLLKTGGYGRLPAYLTNLEREMKRVGAQRIDDYILDARRQRELAANDPIKAGFLNNALIVDETQSDSRYYHHKNKAIHAALTHIWKHSIASPATNAYPFAPTTPISITWSQPWI